MRGYVELINALNSYMVMRGHVELLNVLNSYRVRRGGGKTSRQERSVDMRSYEALIRALNDYQAQQGGGEAVTTDNTRQEAGMKKRTGRQNDDELMSWLASEPQPEKREAAPLDEADGQQIDLAELEQDERERRCRAERRQRETEAEEQRLRQRLARQSRDQVRKGKVDLQSPSPFWAELLSEKAEFCRQAHLPESLVSSAAPGVSGMETAGAVADEPRSEEAPDMEGMMDDLLAGLLDDDTASSPVETAPSYELPSPKVDVWFAERDEELRQALTVLGKTAFPRTQLPRERVAFLFVGGQEEEAVPYVLTKGETSGRTCHGDDVLEELNRQDERWKLIVFGCPALPSGRQVLLCRVTVSLAQIAVERGQGNWPLEEYASWLDWSEGRRVFFMNPDASVTLALRETPWWVSVASTGRLHLVLCVSSEMRRMSSDVHGSREASVINFSRQRQVFCSYAWRHVLDLKSASSGVGGVLFKREDASGLLTSLTSAEDEGSLGLLRGYGAPDCCLPTVKAERPADVPATVVAMSIRMRLMQASFKQIESLLEGTENGLALSEVRWSVFRCLQDVATAGVDDLPEHWRGFCRLLSGIVSYRCAFAIVNELSESIGRMRELLLAEKSTGKQLLSLYRRGQSELNFGALIEAPLSAWSQAVSSLRGCDFAWYAAVEQAVTSFLEAHAAWPQQFVGDADEFRHLYASLRQEGMVYQLVQRRLVNDRLRQLLSGLQESQRPSEMSPELRQECRRLVQTLESSPHGGEATLPWMSGHPLAQEFPEAVTYGVILQKIAPETADRLQELLV